MHDVVIHYGTHLPARILCDVWMYTEWDYGFARGDLVEKVQADGQRVPYRIEEVLVTNSTYQKFRVAKLPA